MDFFSVLSLFAPSPGSVVRGEFVSMPPVVGEEESLVVGVVVVEGRVVGGAVVGGGAI